MPRTPRHQPARSGRARTRIALVLLAGGAVLASAPQTGAMGLPRPDVRFADHLTVAYDDGQGGVTGYVLTCGVLREEQDDQRCAHLAEIGGPVGPVAADQMCSMIYGGPQTARVTGMWRGARVDEDYRRTNGCEVARWSRMVPALPAPSGTVGLETVGLETEHPQALAG